MKKLIVVSLLSFVVLLGSIGPWNQQTASAAFSPDKVINIGKKFIGTPYRSGGSTPKGFDCSGFVGYTYKQATGITLPRSSTSMYSTGKAVSKSTLKKGDILFFNTSGKGISHVAIYIGSNQFIHSASNGVKIDSLSSSYWKPRYVGAKRIS